MREALSSHEKPGFAGSLLAGRSIGMVRRSTIDNRWVLGTHVGHIANELIYWDWWILRGMAL
jgi:hypothetical protein